MIKGRICFFPISFKGDVFFNAKFCFSSTRQSLKNIPYIWRSLLQRTQ